MSRGFDRLHSEVTNKQQSLWVEEPAPSSYHSENGNSSPRIYPTKSEIPRQLSAALNRRDLIRAGLLAAAASALGPSFSLGQAIESGLTPAARGEDGAAFLTDPDWKPAFLNDHQNETLIVLSDVVIPATDTPGAKAALVNRYLDLSGFGSTCRVPAGVRAALKTLSTLGPRESLGRNFANLHTRTRFGCSPRGPIPNDRVIGRERNDPHTQAGGSGTRTFPSP